MSLFVSTTCPGCGAPTRHLEGIVTFKCPYCASVLRVQDAGALVKYVIPARVTKEEMPVAIKRELLSRRAHGIKSIRRIAPFYKPFWYCKGMVYFATAQSEGLMLPPMTLRENAAPSQRAVTRRVQGAVRTTDVVAKMWTHTFPAHEACPALASLGIQSEVLELEPYDSEKRAGDALLPVLLSPEDARRVGERAALHNVNIERRVLDYATFAFIGEKFFVIYYPIVAAICEGSGGYNTFYFDGVNRRFIQDEPGMGILDLLKEHDPEPYKRRLTAHRCPNCGHDLPPHDFDLVYYCQWCFRLWLLAGDKLQSLSKNALGTYDKAFPLYLPFWKFTVSITSNGQAVRTVDGFAKLIKAGELVVKGKDPDAPISFYVPAIVSRNPTAILKLAVRITQAQGDYPRSPFSEFPYTAFHGASMPKEEAAEMLKTIAFSVIGRTDRKATEFYRAMTVEADEPELVWYPFAERGSMLADGFLNFNVAARGITSNLY